MVNLIICVTNTRNAQRKRQNRRFQFRLDARWAASSNGSCLALPVQALPYIWTTESTLCGLPNQEQRQYYNIDKRRDSTPESVVQPLPPPTVPSSTTATVIQIRRVPPLGCRPQSHLPPCPHHHPRGTNPTAVPQDRPGHLSEPR